MAKINGLPVNFGFTATNGSSIGVALGSGANPTPFTGFLLQSTDESIEADKEEVRDGIGNVAVRSWYDFHGVCSLECVITGSTIANAVKNTTLSPFSPGQFLTLTACASAPDIAGISAGGAGGTNLGAGGAPGTMTGTSAVWEIVGAARIRQSNTGSSRITIPIEFRSNIQGPATP